MSTFAYPVLPPGTERFAAGYIIEFSDGGDPEECVLHVGTREACERVMSVIPAVAYSGPRPNPRARGMVIPFPEGETK